MGHTSFSPDSEEFWDFNYEQYGMKDLPAYIDFILEVTGQQQLTYVGHSEGTTMMFIAGSLNPNYFKEKLNLVVALAPAANFYHNEVPAF